MNDCDKLLQEVLFQAKALQIPTSDRIDPHVRINPRTVTRLGCCKYENEQQIIEVSQRVAEGTELVCREVLAHEILHTCKGCQNHGSLWKLYALKMNQAYGYHISRTATAEELGLKTGTPWKYILTCEKCGAEFGRYRLSALVRHPEKYRCRCGGRLKRRV